MSILGHAHLQCVHNTNSPIHNTALPVCMYTYSTWGECLPRTEFVYLSLPYALKCDGRENSGQVWVMHESIDTS